MALPVTHINRRTCSRPADKQMEVLCLGLSRTGTDSMRVALKILGYDDVYHGNSCAFENPTDLYMWEEASRAKYDGIGKLFERADWDQLLGHCQAVTDIPANQFGPELIAAYPTAKIILTTRPIDAWHASVLGSIESQRRSWAIGFFNLFHADGWLASKAWDVWSRAWEGDFEKNGKRIFVEHNENVRRLAAGNLLEFRVEQGWEPLCEFLGKPIPEVPFPNGNGMKAFNDKFNIYVMQRLKETAMNVLVLGGGVGLAVIALKYRTMIPGFRG